MEHMLPKKAGLGEVSEVELSSMADKESIEEKEAQLIGQPSKDHNM